jgi:hypothetical protein
MEGCFGNFHYGLIIGETYTKACNRLEAIDKEARMNEGLHRLFGGEVLARKSIENRIFFKTGAMLEAWGWEQELQSFKYHDFRPDLAYLDDIENRERVRDAGAVDESMRKLWLELIPAMDKTRRRIRFGETRRAEDGMVTRLQATREWVYYGVPICSGAVDDPATQSNWPARYPMEWIRAEKARYEAAGMLDEFLQSYMLQVTDPERKPFKEEMFGIIDASPFHWTPRVAIYDPARTSRTKAQATRGKPESDRFGKVVVSRSGSRILVHESSGTHLRPSEFIDDVFATQKRHQLAKVCVEKNSLDDWILQPLRIASLDRGIPLPIVALQAPQDRSKDEFIMSLQPFGESHDIVLVGGKLAHAALVAEWVNFPNGSRDILNALAYSLRVFSGRPIYDDFRGDNVADNPDLRAITDLYCGFHATPNETVAVVFCREKRRFHVLADFVYQGSIPDGVADIMASMGAAFPGRRPKILVPADTCDQEARIPLVPALKRAGLRPQRGKGTAASRGCLAERIRTKVHDQHLLTVSRKAPLVLNALSMCYAIEAGRQEPTVCTERLAAEALECAIAALELNVEAGAIPEGANVAYSPSGYRYITAHPARTRAR